MMPDTNIILCVNWNLGKNLIFFSKGKLEEKEEPTLVSSVYSQEFTDFIFGTT